VIANSISTLARSGEGRRRPQTNPFGLRLLPPLDVRRTDDQGQAPAPVPGDGSLQQSLRKNSALPDEFSFTSESCGASKVIAFPRAAISRSCPLLVPLVLAYASQVSVANGKLLVIGGGPGSERLRDQHDGQSPVRGVRLSW